MFMSDALITDEEILRVLYVNNPWWGKKPIPNSKLKPFKRRGYHAMIKSIKHVDIFTLIGPRQVGKTTLLYQTIEELLNEIHPINILFVRLDDPYLDISMKNLDRIFTLYSTIILKKEFSLLKEKIYIILDEIQSLKNWEGVLKRWFDLGYNIKFIATGSSSIDIIRRSTQTLTGRITYQILLPMKFLEFIMFREQNELSKSVDRIPDKLRRQLRKSIEEQDNKFFFKKLESINTLLIPHEIKIKTLIEEYLVKGGYTQNVNVDDLSLCNDNLRQYLNQTIYKDVIINNELRDPSKLESLMMIIAKESSSLLSRKSVSTALEITSNTLNQYIELLKDAYLISEAPFYSKRVIKSTRMKKKMYVNDVGLRNMLVSALDSQILSDENMMGKVVETVIADHTKRLKYNISKMNADIFYWHDEYEVDLVLELFQKTIPIEVKYSNNVTLEDLKGIRKFNKKFKSKISFVITKKQLEIHDDIIFIPLWLYLLMC